MQIFSHHNNLPWPHAVSSLRCKTIFVFIWALTSPPLLSLQRHNASFTVVCWDAFLFKLLRFECCTWLCCNFVNILINCQCISIINLRQFYYLKKKKKKKKKIHTVFVAYSQTVLCRFISWLNYSARGNLRMTDVRHLKSSGTPGWMESGQINAITQVSGEAGDKGTQSVCPLCWSSWRGSSTSPASAWNGRQLTDLASATLPWGPHRCLAKSPGRSASRARPRRVWWMPRLACRGGCTTTGFKCSVSRPLKSPLSFSVRPNMSCRAYLKIYSLSMSHLTAASSSSSLPSCTQLLPLLFSLPHSHSICQSYQHVSGFWSDPFVREYQFINQSVHTLIGSGGTGSYIQCGGDWSWSCTCIRHLD